MDKHFNPTESDCQWTKDMLKKVKVGGLWRTSFGLYKKTSETGLRLMIKIITPNNKSDSNIYRVKRTMEVMHYDYSEADPLDIAILPENPMKNFRSGEDLVAILDDKPIRSKLSKCSKCGYWHTENKCPNCGTISGWSDHRHGVEGR